METPNLEQPAAPCLHTADAPLALPLWHAGRAEYSELGQNSIALHALFLFPFRDSYVLFYYCVGKDCISIKAAFPHS